jgi:ketosteroid isomerase-like protein
MVDLVSEDRKERIKRLYAAFNVRDIESILTELTDDVRWANGMDGGHVSGRNAVREYWTRQFLQISSTVVPEHIESGQDGRVAVRVHQIVRPAGGSAVIADTTVSHLFTFTGQLISRFDIE